MKPLHIFLIASLAFNTLLAGYWVKSHRSATAAKLTGGAAPLAEQSNHRDAKIAMIESADGFYESTSTQVEAPLTWLDIQSVDLKEYVARLRAAGCPEETVADIILADVNRRFAARSRELWPERFAEYKYWQVEQRHNPEKARQQREQWRKDRELQREKSALLVELLGFDPERQQRLEDGHEEFTHWLEQRVAFLPESKRDAALQILDDFQDQEQEMYALNAGIWDAQSRADRRQMEAAKLAALAAVLSPEELREYELRQSQTATQLTHELRSLEMNRTEYEAIFDVRKKYGDSIYNYGDLDADGRKQAEANKKQMNQELAAALGADKFKQYERSQDHQYQQLARLAKRNELPADTADKVYDFKNIAEDGRRRLHENKEFSSEQRQAALKELRAETENTLKQALGEKAYQTYLKNGGWWINNISSQRAASPRN